MRRDVPVCPSMSQYVSGVEISQTFFEKKKIEQKQQKIKGNYWGNDGNERKNV